MTTPANALCSALPKFVTVKGTLGNPMTDLDKFAPGSLLRKSGTGVVGKFSGNWRDEGGNVLQSLGGLLTGPRPANTNQPAANAAPKFNPLDPTHSPRT